MVQDISRDGDLPMSASRIDALLSQMTLTEKIGQLNMLAAGFSVTGPILGGDASGAVREGRAGSLSTSSAQDLCAISSASRSKNRA